MDRSNTIPSWPSRKGPKDFVTASDIKAEQIIYDDLSYARPDYSFIMEERGSVDIKDSEFRWVIDPLDGTINFLHGISSFCISIALEKRISKTRREIQAAVILSPIHKELFWAEKGQGAWLESTENRPITRLRVANRNKLNDTLLCVGSPKRDMTGTEEILDEVSSTRTFGTTALALAYVAAGRFDCFFQTGMSYWDIAAGALLVKEAGGYITDYQNNNALDTATSIIAANESLHGLVIKKLKN